MIDDKVAPSLQAARDQLQKSQLQVRQLPISIHPFPLEQLTYTMYYQDKLDHALTQRPKKEELIQGGILSTSSVDRSTTIK